MASQQGRYASLIPPEILRVLGRYVPSVHRFLTTTGTLSRPKINWLRLAAVFFVCNLALFAASWISLFNITKIDDRLERHFRTYASAFAFAKPSRQVVLICADEDPGKNGTLGQPDVVWRQYHTKLVNALKGHAKVIAFDLRFDTPSQWDPDFVKALKDAEAAGTKIVLGTEDFTIVDGSPVPSISSTFESVLTRNNWAILKTGGYTDSQIVQQYKMAESIEEEANPFFVRLDVVPSLALQAFKASLAGDPQIIFEREKGKIELQDPQILTLASIPVDDHLNGRLDLVSQTDINEIPYHVVYENLNETGYLKKFDHKFVLIGFKLKGLPPQGDEFSVSDNEKRFGIEIHANALMNLISGKLLQPIPLWVHYGLIVLMSLVGIVLKMQTRRWGLRIPVFLLCVTALYLLGILIVFMFYRVTLSSSYHVASLFGTYFLAGIAIK